MRITTETLIKIANDFIAQRSKSERDLLAAYLHGSLLTEAPLLGGVTDIDLFCIHLEPVKAEREIVRITDEVHLDIAHYPREIYRQARELRLHPWLGPCLYGCKILYDPQHFLDFIQASVRGQFYRADQVLGRARPQVEHARQIWMAFYRAPESRTPEEVSRYLRAVGQAANAVASLSGAPLTERRFLIGYQERAAAVRRPGLYPGLLGLLGAPAVTAEGLQGWMRSWRRAYEAFPAGVTARLQPTRVHYYGRAFESLLGGEHPELILWPLLSTWTRMAAAEPADSPHLAEWQAAMGQLHLVGDGFVEKVAALDAYLDMVEETLEAWGREYGA